MNFVYAVARETHMETCSWQEEAVQGVEGEGRWEGKEV